MHFCLVLAYLCSSELQISFQSLEVERYRTKVKSLIQTIRTNKTNTGLKGRPQVTSLTSSTLHGLISSHLLHLKLIFPPPSQCIACVVSQKDYKAGTQSTHIKHCLMSRKGLNQSLVHVTLQFSQITKRHLSTIGHVLFSPR